MWKYPSHWEFSKLTWNNSPDKYTCFEPQDNPSRLNIKKNQTNNTFISVFSNEALPDNSINYFEVRFKNFNNKRETSNIIVGIAINPKENQINEAFTNNQNGFGFYLKFQSLRHGSSFWGRHYADTKDKITSEDVIAVIVDKIDGTLSYLINGIEYGIAFVNEKIINENVYAALSFSSNVSSIEFVKSRFYVWTMIKGILYIRKKRVNKLIDGLPISLFRELLFYLY
ncbi:unnamed protein product [Blepharisma stoltei]|uniref:B30.2/SPRY domain-containing protein n=1 Tax=Blepharisma stoltei TaxID=1481888 RepID=A0AAU9J198_9CILI|nr:unnamed protein product [Blepharisma stoltei]